MDFWEGMEADLTAIVQAVGSPPDDTPAGIWDVWELPVLWYPMPMTFPSIEPNTLPLAYPIPWQIYPQC